MIRLGHTSICPDVNIWFCQSLKDFSQLHKDYQYYLYTKLV